MQQPPIDARRGEIRITFQDESKETNQTSSTSVETVISIADLKRALEAIQFGVWTTAAIELGRTSHEDLSDEEKQQYTLVVVTAQQGHSLTTDLMFLAVVMTAHGTGALPHDVAMILEAEIYQRLWNTLARTIDGMNEEYSASSDRSDKDRVASGDGLQERLRFYAQKIARSARNSGHQILVLMKDPWGREAKLQTHREGNDRLLGSSPSSMRQLADPIDQRKPIYTYENGVTVDAATDHTIILKFDEYTQPILCHIPANRHRMISDLVPGDSLTVYGHPNRHEWDRPDAPPRSIDVVDVTQIHRNVWPRI